MLIKVPATSTNLGPGFDSVGVALSKYLEIEVLEEADEWFIEHTLDGIAHDKSNLLLQTALQIAPDLQPHRLRMLSDIPLARGLGASSSVIVAGVELANQLAHLDLTADRKLAIASAIEGHPDNVAPAIFGSLIIASQVNRDVSYIKAPFPTVGIVAYIPDYELKTTDSRAVLPQQFSYKQAVTSSSVANVAIAALLTGNMVEAGRAIENDQFHEIYRQKLVPEFQEIKHTAKQVGAYATYLSGAGPTVISLCPMEVVPDLLETLHKLNLAGEVLALSVDQDGLVVSDN
ncbi:homoserine kinase [Streptococcus halichoeri]|uniref:homoserine kinase n=1 Tax=Streptococcus halichoeri TaxID=254785 RepID=UPI000DB4B2A8|nr:homoserine kinase [Streptococcus halichoeri]PZO94413.1 MAG: homoserine kinase [Streptococcus pyogenes]